MAAPRKNVLCIAIKNVTPDMTVPPPLAKWTPDAVASVFKEQAERLAHAGIDITTVYADTVGVDSIAELSRVYGSRHWDGVLFGGGMRTILELVQLFQDALNVVVGKGQSPPPRIVFTNGPGQMYERVAAALDG